MPFIGNQPALAYTSLAKQDFTTSATTSYVLDNPVANANEIALFINFVRQEPTTAYTASGTTLTLTSATSATDDMYCVFLGKAVQTVNPPNGSVGTSQITDGAVTSAKLGSDVTQGITEADQWRLTANFTGSVDPIASNLERNDNASFGYIGTGMSESSGIFSFPQTGIYLVEFVATMERVSNDALVTYGISGTTDNSSYSNLARNFTNTGTISASYNEIIVSSFFDVTDTSTHKVKFFVSSSVQETIGVSSENHTYMTFIRLGDT